MDRYLSLLCLLVLFLPVIFWPFLYHPYAPLKFGILISVTPMMGYAIYARLRSRGKNGLAPLSPLWIALALEGLSFLLGTLISIHPRVSFWGSYERRMGTVTFLACGTTALLASEVVVSVQKFKRLVRFLIYGGILSAIISLASFYCERAVQGIQSILSLHLPGWERIASFWVTERLDGTLGNPNYYANYLLFPSMCAVGWLWVQRSRKARFLGLTALILGLWCLIISQTRGAQLGWVAGLCVFLGWILLFQKERISNRALLLLSCLILLAGGILAATFLGRTDLSGSGRIWLWKDSLPLLSRSWLIGTGVEGFRAAFMPYKSLQLAQFSPNANWETAHNAILDTWITLGLLGLFGYLFLIGVSIRGWWLAIKKCASQDRSSLPLLLSALGAMVSYLVHNLFNCDTTVTFFLFHLFAGAGWGLAREAKDMEKIDEKIQPYSSNYPLAKTLACVLTLMISIGALGLILADHAAFLSWQHAAPGKDTDKAIHYGKKALILSPLKDFYHYVFARAMDVAYFTCLPERRENLLSMAIEHALLAAQTPSTNPESRLITLASLQYRKGLLFSASETINEALKIDPHYWGIHRLKALLLIAQGDSEGAMKWMKRACEVNPGQPEVRNLFQRVWAVRIPPGSQLEYEKAINFRDQGQFDLAVDAYETALREANHEFPKAWNSLGSVLETKEDWIGAEKAYRKALELTEGYLAESNIGLSRILIRTDRSEEAFPYLERTRQVHPEWSEPWKHLLIIHIQEGREKEAKTSLREYLAREKEAEEREKVQRYFQEYLR